MVPVDPKILEAKNKAEESLLKLPGVNGVDIGFKEVGGKPTNQLAIRVLVTQKRDVPKAQRIPSEIDGIPTDVIQRKFELHQFVSKLRVEELHPMVDAGTYTPLKGGISIGPCRAVGGFVFAGTLGCFVIDNVSGKHMMLSNFHVMCIDNGHAVGDTMAQPSRVDGGACPGSIVGTLARQSLGGKVDCAVADVTGSRGNSCEIVDIGYVAGQGTASLGQAVRKRGRTTMLTYGIVDSIHLTVTVDYEDGIGNVTLTDQIGIKPDTTKNPKFGDHGDSGSALVDDARNVIGLYFAGDDTGYGVANPIAAVLTALNVKLCIGGIKFKDFKDHKHEIKEFKHEKFEHKELKIEKFEHKELKIELKEKNELKEIAKFEHPEKTIREKGGKELVEGGPDFPGGPGDPGPIGGLIGSHDAQAAGKFAEASPNKPLKEFKSEKFEQKDFKAEGKEDEKPYLVDHKQTPKELTPKELKVESPTEKPFLADHKATVKDHKIEVKEHKPEHKIEIKERIKEHKIEKIESKDIAKLEHPEKQDFKEKDGKELKEGGFEGPGGPGDPGPIFGQAAAAQAGGAKLTDLKPKEFKELKSEKYETKEIKIEKNEFKDHKPEKFEKNELKDHKHEKPEHKIELKEHKREKLEIKELKQEKHEKIETKEITKLEQPEKQDFKEKDGKELKEGSFEGPGPGGPGDPGPIFGQAAAAQAGGKLTDLKSPKEFKEFKAEKAEKNEAKEFSPDKTTGKEFKDKEIKYEKNEIKEFKPEKAEKNELKDHKHEKPEHKVELKEHKNEKLEIKELKREKIEQKEIIKEISKLEHPEKTGFKEKDGKELKEGGFEGPRPRRAGRSRTDRPAAVGAGAGGGDHRPLHLGIATAGSVARRAVLRTRPRRPERGAGGPGEDRQGRQGRQGR